MSVFLIYSISRFFQIFTDEDPVVESLPRGHVLSFIENVSKDIAISYLVCNFSSFKTNGLSHKI